MSKVKIKKTDGSFVMGYSDQSGKVFYKDGTPAKVKKYRDVGSLKKQMASTAMSIRDLKDAVKFTEMPNKEMFKQGQKLTKCLIDAEKDIVKMGAMADKAGK